MRYLIVSILMTISLIACISLRPEPENNFPHTENLIVVAIDDSHHLNQIITATTPTPYGLKSRYMTSPLARTTMQDYARQFNMDLISSWEIPELKYYCVVFDTHDPQKRDEILIQLSKLKTIRIAEPLQQFHGLTNAYNDPYYDLQKGFQRMDVAPVQRLTQGEGIKVAIIDTGVNSLHPDLLGRVTSMRNFVDSDSQRFQSDRHGTEVAGIIAANANNGQGIVGIAPSTTLLSIKACWENPLQHHEQAYCNTYTLAKAISEAISMNADIINLSLGGPPDRLLDQLVKSAIEKRIIVIASAPPLGDIEGFPVSTPGVIVVDLGNSPQNRDESRLHAPGKDIITLFPDGQYSFASGSSLSTAHVSGLAALLLSLQKLSHDEMQSLLKSSETTDQYGMTSINACLAVKYLRPSLTCTQDNTMPTSGIAVQH